MKKLVPFALILVALPLCITTLADSPAETSVAETTVAETGETEVPAEADATPSLEILKEIPALQSAEPLSVEKRVTLEALFGDTVSAACIDSGIPCGDCTAVCYPLECQCWGTCVYCP